MMESLDGHLLWHEPLVGEMFGDLLLRPRLGRAQKSRHFILGRHRETWLSSIRSFVLNGATARFPGIGDELW